MNGLNTKPNPKPGCATSNCVLLPLLLLSKGINKVQSKSKSKSLRSCDDVFTAETLCDIFQLYFRCFSCISFLSSLFTSYSTKLQNSPSLSLRHTHTQAHAHRHSIGFYAKVGVCSHSPQPSEGRQDDKRLWHLTWQMPSLSFPHVHVCSKSESSHRF